jgi:predicted transcriptional regulator
MGRKKTIKTINEVLENSKTDQQPQEENLVKKTCRELGITQKELAGMMGLTERSLTRYATDHNNMPENISNHIKTILDLYTSRKVINILKESFSILKAI